MNTTNRTLTFSAVAAFAVVSALAVKYINRPMTNADFADVGQHQKAFDEVRADESRATCDEYVLFRKHLFLKIMNAIATFNPLKINILAWNFA